MSEPRLTTDDIARVLGAAFERRPLGISQLITVAPLIKDFAELLDLDPVQLTSYSLTWAKHLERQEQMRQAAVREEAAAR